MPANENVTSSAQDSLHITNHVTTIVQGISLAVLGVFTILGNLAIAVTFIRAQSLRKRCYYLLICLSIADVGVGIVVFMNVYFFLTDTQVKTFVTALDFADTLTGFTSILTLACMSAERFYAVFYPFKHRTVRFKFYVALFTLPWAVATVIACVNYVASFDVAFLSIYTYMIFTVITISLVLITCNYMAIAIRSKNTHPNGKNKRQSLRDKKLVVTLVIVTLSSIVTWLPVQCLFAAIYFCNVTPHVNVFFAMKFLQFSNSAINAFVYFWRIEDFRKAFLVMLCGKPRVCHVTNGEPTENIALRPCSQ